MKKRPNLLKFMIFAALAAVLTIYLASDLLARAGRSGGSSSRSSSRSYSSSSRSYGSSSRSYGSSSSYGRGSSYGSSYGSGYGSSYGSSSYGYGGGYRRSYGSSYGSSRYYGRSGGSVLSTIIIIAIISVFVIVVFVFIKRSGSSEGYSSGGLFGSGATYGSGSPFGSAGAYGSGSSASSFSGGGYNYGRSAVRNPEAEERVRYVFEKVQRAWAERDQYIASDCMSERMFREHKEETDEMISNRERNILENIVINEITITKFSDGAGSGYDSGLEPSSSSYGYGGSSIMEARISASMIDYVIDENTGSVIDGDANIPDRFTETWRFIKNENGWVLDEIL